MKDLLGLLVCSPDFFPFAGLKYAAVWNTDIKTTTTTTPLEPTTTKLQAAS